MGERCPSASAASLPLPVSGWLWAIAERASVRTSGIAIREVMGRSNCKGREDVLGMVKTLQEMQRQPWHGTRSETLWGSFAARSHAFALTQDDKGLGVR